MTVAVPLCQLGLPARMLTFTARKTLTFLMLECCYQMLGKLQ